MKALIIVDMQKGFIKESNCYLVDNINKLISENRFDKVIATKFVNNADSQYVKFLNWSKMIGEEEQEFAISLPANAIIAEKTSYGLDENALAKAGGGEVFVCGTDYDACVLALGYQLFDRGIQPKFIWDCIGSAASVQLDKDLFEKMYKRSFGKDCIVKGNKNG